PAAKPVPYSIASPPTCIRCCAHSSATCSGPMSLRETRTVYEAVRDGTTVLPECTVDSRSSTIVSAPPAHAARRHRPAGAHKLADRADDRSGRSDGVAAGRRCAAADAERPRRRRQDAARYRGGARGCWRSGDSETSDCVTLSVTISGRSQAKL